MNESIFNALKKKPAFFFFLENEYNLMHIWLSSIQQWRVQTA